MELTLKGSWIETVGGAWVNLRHCDLIECVEATRSGAWRVQVWNAHQAHMEPHCLAEFEQESDAAKWARGLIEELSKLPQ